MSKRALVTGASGFIGSRLIEDLASQGFDVLALMRRTSSDANLQGLNYRRVEGDLSDYDSLKKAAREADYVFHLAGAIMAPDRAGFFKHNAEGTANLVRAVAESGGKVERLVYVSSLASGGPSTSVTPRSERDEDRPVSFYGESKLQGEIEALKFRDQVPLSIVRPPVVYGPKDKNTFLLVQTVARGIVPVLSTSVSQDGHKRYSMVHVEDLTHGIIQAAIAPGLKQLKSGEVFYVAGDEIVTYSDWMGTIAQALNKRPLKIPVPMSVLGVAAHGLGAISKVTGKSFSLNPDKMNEIRPDFWICSNQKAKSQIGFDPKRSFVDGMTQTVLWYKENGWL